MKKFIMYFILFMILFLGFQRLVQPKYDEDLVEGSMTSEYYDSSKNHQIIFLGDCEVYSSYSPIVLFNEFGYTSYIRGNSQQMIYQSYHLLRETLQYEIPKIVVFNVNALRHGELDKNEGYNRLMIDEMRNSKIKYDLINDSLTKNETIFDYVFPIFRYHSRIFELTKEDFEYFFKDKTITHNGYLMRVDVKPVTTMYEGLSLANYDFSKENMEYLDKIRELCEKNDIELILVKAPSTYPYWYPEYDEQVVEYSQKYGLEYINFLDLRDEIGIDYNTDTYDAGLHLNLSGAEKLTRYFGNYLQHNHNLDDMRNDEEISREYHDKSEYYVKIQKEQFKELKKYGKIVMYGG